MTPEDFDAHFGRFTATAFRLETRQNYIAPGEAERIDAFLRGLPRPERSVRTEPWLARIAVTTATEGKRWQRVRVVEEPLTDYTRYELAGYVESQAAGEQILIDLWPPGRAGKWLRRDFWLFDAGTPAASALLLHYGDDGTWLGAELVTDPAVLAEFTDEYQLARKYAVPLNEYLAAAAGTAA